MTRSIRLFRTLVVTTLLLVVADRSPVRATEHREDWPTLDWSFLFGVSTGPFDTEPGPFVAAVLGIPIFDEDPVFGHALSADLLLGWSQTEDRGTFHTPAVTALGLDVDPVANTRLDVTTFQASPGLRYALRIPGLEFVRVDPYVVAGMTMNAALSRTDGPGGERVLGISRSSPEVEETGIPPIGGNVLLGAVVGGGLDVTTPSGLVVGVEMRRNEMPREGASFETVAGRLGFRFATGPSAPRRRGRSPATEYSYAFVAGVSTGPFGTEPGPYLGTTIGIPIFTRDPLLGQSLSLDFLLGWGETEEKGRFAPPTLTALDLPAQPSSARRLTVTTLQVVPGLRVAPPEPWRIGPFAITPHALAGIGFDLLLAATEGPRGERPLGISEISPEVAARGLPAAGGQAYVEGNFGVGFLAAIFDDLLWGVDVRHNLIDREGASYQTISARFGFRFGVAPPPVGSSESRSPRLPAAAPRTNDLSPHRSLPSEASRAASTSREATAVDSEGPRFFEYSYLFGVSTGPFGTGRGPYVGGTLSVPIFARDPLFGQRLSGDMLFGWTQSDTDGRYRAPAATLLRLPVEPDDHSEFDVSSFQVVPSFKYELTFIPRLRWFHLQPYALAGVAFNASFGRTSGASEERVLGIAPASPDLAERGVPSSGGGVLIGGNFGAGLDVVWLDRLLVGVEFRHNAMARRGGDFETITGKLGFRFSGFSFTEPRPFRLTSDRSLPAPPSPLIVETDEELVPLSPVRFESGRDVPRPEAHKVLDAAAAILARRPHLFVAVEASELSALEAEAESAISIAHRRASAIARELAARGVSPERILVPEEGDVRSTDYGNDRAARTTLRVLFETPSTSRQLGKREE